MDCKVGTREAGQEMAVVQVGDEGDLNESGAGGGCGFKRCLAWRTLPQVLLMATPSFRSAESLCLVLPPPLPHHAPLTLILLLTGS